MPSITSNGPSATAPGALQQATEQDWALLPSSYRPPERALSLAEARNYCERLARSHYENFSVATWFLPRELRQDFFNVYAYCRISDDLADEVLDSEAALRLLDAWEAELNACYAGVPRHPVFVALAETVRKHNIPRQTFSDLLIAFRRDQFITRYESFHDLLGYCRYSANPVGHLVLYVCGYGDPERQQLADYTCTALQLANFWQDVARDYARGRIYLPAEDMRRFEVTEADLKASQASAAFVEMMRFEVSRAHDWFERGLPLVKMVDKRLATDIVLFTRGGQEILAAIERQGYDVLRARPVIPRGRKLRLVLRAARERLW